MLYPNIVFAIRVTLCQLWHGILNPLCIWWPTVLAMLTVDIICMRQAAGLGASVYSSLCLHNLIEL